MKITRRRLMLSGAILFLLGAASSEGGAALVHAVQGGNDLGMAQARAVQNAAEVDDQQLVTASSAADLALSSDNHQMFSMVGLQGTTYTDTVRNMRSSLNLAADNPEPEWFYTCFGSTESVMKGSARIFNAASGVPTWSDSQGAVIRQTVTDLGTASQYVDRIVTGGHLIDPKAPVLVPPNGTFDSQQLCDQINKLAGDLTQRQWPG